jgi:flagellar basal-body rod modification protein FlgD
MTMSEIQSAESQKIDFMNLLITQMQNQNPLEPMSNEQMAAQMATFSQLELSEEMNTNIESMNSSMVDLSKSFEGAMLVAEFDYAKNLLGKEVSFYDTTYGQDVTGEVKKITFDEGRPQLEVHAAAMLSDGTVADDLVFGIGLEHITGITEKDKNLL